MAEDTREWVRDHTIAGFVVTRFVGVYAGEQRELAVVQTWDGARIVPSAALIPIDRSYMVEKAGLNLERVIHGMLEGGLDLDDAQAAWERAIGHVRRTAG
ncbi:MAG: hypothetical protein IPP13_28350 [Kouleothrix sp.]|jgi:hypothetical protein|nr:hypothetical protein [Kouleothrix sp.]